jgi:cytochrome c biogenesis protein CcmG, thiol:disulfide interchange protein DsbE
MRWFHALPALAFLALTVVFVTSLMRSVGTPPDTLASALDDGPAPALKLPNLDAKARAYGPQDLASGHVTILNVWASWCVPCRAEAPALSRLAQIQGVALYGLVYKDTPARARAFLNETGDPYQRIDLDTDGRAGVAWGIDGVPETFVIDGNGIVRLRFPGPLVGSALMEIVLPAVEKARRSSPR